MIWPNGLCDFTKKRSVFFGHLRYHLLGFQQLLDSVRNLFDAFRKPLIWLVEGV